MLPDGTKKRYKFARLPPYLLVSYRRFSENNFLVEKNSTIVNFVLKGLDLKEYLHPPESERDALRQWKPKKLKKRLVTLGGSRRNSAPCFPVKPRPGIRTRETFRVSSAPCCVAPPFRPPSPFRPFSFFLVGVGLGATRTFGRNGL